MRIFQNTKDKLHLYKSLDTLKILTFWKVLETQNALLLDFDYKEGKNYSDEQKMEIEAVWLRLYDEYYVMRDSSKSRMQLIRSFDELRLIEKIQQITKNAEFLQTLKGYYGLIPEKQLIEYEQSVYEILKKIDKKIKPLFFDGIDANITNLDRFLKSYINKYNQEYQKREETVKKEISNVYEIVAAAESWLERSIPITDMVTSHWLAIEKQIDNKHKAQEKKKK